MSPHPVDETDTCLLPRRHACSQPKRTSVLDGLSYGERATGIRPTLGKHPRDDRGGADAWVAKLELCKDGSAFNPALAWYRSRSIQYTICSEMAKDADRTP